MRPGWQQRAAGRTVDDIAEDLGVTRARVCAALDRHGLPRVRRPDRRRGDPGAVIEAYRAGASLEAAATAAGVTDETARRWLITAGVPRRSNTLLPHQRRHLEDAAWLTRQRELGHSMRKIARHLKVGSTTVRMAMIRLGVT